MSEWLVGVVLLMIWVWLSWCDGFVCLLWLFVYLFVTNVSFDCYHYCIWEWLSDFYLSNKFKTSKKEKNWKIKWPRLAKIEINKKKLYVCCKIKKFLINVLVLLVFLCLFVVCNIVANKMRKDFFVAGWKKTLFFSFKQIYTFVFHNQLNEIKIINKKINIIIINFI